MSEEKHSLEAGQFEPQRQNMISRMLGKYVDDGRNTNYIKAHPLKKKPNIFIWQHCTYVPQSLYKEAASDKKLPH